MNRRLLIGTVSALLIAAMAMMYVMSDELEAYFWRWTYTWSISKEDQAAVERCSDIRWLTFAKIQHHMVKDQCSLEWLARHSVLIDDVQKRDWLKNQASQSSSPADNRFRAHFLLWVAKSRTAGFPIVLEQASQQKQDAFSEWVVTSPLDNQWLSPNRRVELGVTQLQRDMEPTYDVLHTALLLERLKHSMLVDASHRSSLVNLALIETGFLKDEIRPGNELQQSDGSAFPYQVPETCTTLIDPECLRWFAHHLPKNGDVEWSALERPSLTQKQRVRFTTLEHIINEGVELDMAFLESLRVLWAEYAIWYESLMPSERWPVLYFWFFDRSPPFGPTGQKVLQEMHPMSRSILGRSTPWMALSALVDLFPELTVYRNPKEPKTALFVAPDGLTYRVNPCQVSRIDAIDDINVWRALSKTEIAAGAALELASHAWAEDRILDAEQYLRLAHRWDPNSTQRLPAINEEVQTKTAEAPRLNAMFSHAMPQLTLQNSLYSAQGPCSTSAFWEQ